MRVIAGTAKHLALKCPDGLSTRPTTDRIKETLFNMIQNDVVDARFLDLFSGSGAIGIEALSRGAKEAVFVEADRKTASYIQDNLKFTRLEKNAKIMITDAVAAVSRLNGSGPFDVIFMDPPYDHALEKEVLIALRDTDVADPCTLIIIEASLGTDFDYLKDYGYEMIKYKKYKTNAHIFCKLME